MKISFLRRLVMIAVATVINLLIYYELLLIILPTEWAIAVLVVMYIMEQAFVSEYNR